MRLPTKQKLLQTEHGLHWIFSCTHQTYLYWVHYFIARVFSLAPFHCIHSL